MNTILVTGSEGNIGTYIVRRLMGKPDVKVVRVGRKPRQIDNYYAGDLRDAEFVKKIFAENKIDYVIHAAAENYSAELLKSDPFGILHNDIASTLNVLDASKGVKKFIFLSSSSIYESVEKVPFVEEQVAAIPMPKSPIGIAKFFGERTLEMFAAQHKIKYTIWRGFNIVSPLEPHDTSGGHVYVDFYRKLFVEKRPKIEIFGSGKQIRCFLWVEDAANAIADFFQDSRTDNQIFNLGSSEQTTLLDLIKILILIGKDKKLLLEDYDPSIQAAEPMNPPAGEAGRHATKPKNSVPDLSKVEQVLNWRAETSFQQCFEKFIAAKARA